MAAILAGVEEITGISAGQRLIPSQPWATPKEQRPSTRVMDQVFGAQLQPGIQGLLRAVRVPYSPPAVQTDPRIP